MSLLLLLKALLRAEDIVGDQTLQETSVMGRRRNRGCGRDRRLLVRLCGGRNLIVNFVRRAFMQLGQSVGAT